MRRLRPRAFSLVELLVVIAGVGALTTLAVPALRAHACRSAQPDVERALTAIASFEERAHAERGGYAAVRARCPPSTACIEFRGGVEGVVFSATPSPAGYTAHAVGRAGVWRVDESGRIVDVTGRCRSGR